MPLLLFTLAVVLRRAVLNILGRATKSSFAFFPSEMKQPHFLHRFITFMTQRLRGVRKNVVDHNGARAALFRPIV